MTRKIFIGILLLFSIISIQLNAQGYLHTYGKNIVDGAGENVILRGIGTGNWMLQEGYMMKTEGVAGTQHEFRAKLIETIGVEKTDSFYNVWLENHFRRIDVDSMKAWGFNSVRVAMHYKWLTLPIEDEPVSGENTWLDKGFVMLDSLLDWCSDAEMYLIFDLHGAPGGQGRNADICDYDPTKPSLWESQENKDKTVALWHKLAERYSTESWNGGYDLINETYWTFPEGNNSQLRELFEDITAAIREVDTNHIIFIEGNDYANDHSGLTPPWDDNLVYSFHRYNASTKPTDLDWILSLQNNYDVPLWFGESGENSNTWYTDMIALSELHNIGWSWWPVKKNSINNVMNVTLNEDYINLIKYWRGEISTSPSEEEAFQAVLQWAENHKLENCKIQYDVIDAMLRQPNTENVIPFKQYHVSNPLFATDFDLGKNNIAYYDNQVAYYGGSWTDWNAGWVYRNDGVDIEPCEDTPVSNGYNVGWTEDGEWMQYSLVSDSSAAYTLNVRSASGSSKIHLEVNNIDVTGEIITPSTGGYQNWQTTRIENIIIPAGENKVKFVIDQGGSNLNYFSFTNPKSVDSVEFHFVSAKTSDNGKEIYLTLNKEVTTPDVDIPINDFMLSRDGISISIDSIKISESSDKVLVLVPSEGIYYNSILTISYDGSSVQNNAQNLIPFTDQKVTNNLPDRFVIPGRIEAEDFYYNNGFELENCTDAGNGYNTAYAALGDYLDYLVYIPLAGHYTVDYRVATERTNAELVFQIGDGESFISLDTIRFLSTNGWQNWQTQAGGSFYLEEGYYTVRLLVKQGEHNLNWFRISNYNTINHLKTVPVIKVYPNPAQDYVLIELSERPLMDVRLNVIDISGRLLLSLDEINTQLIKIDTHDLMNGIYFLRLLEGEKIIGLTNIVINR
jgi:endoglucanase